jgi:hypothetical protein
MGGQHISKEKQQLLEKAELYLQEWEEARLNLENSSKDIGRKIVLVIVIGLSLLYIFKLLGSDEEDQPKTKRSQSKIQNRFFRAARNLALPILIRSMKNIILNENDQNSEVSDEHVD